MIYKELFINPIFVKTPKYATEVCGSPPLLPTPAGGSSLPEVLQKGAGVHVRASV